MRLDIYNENNLDILPHLPDNSVDSVVTDPPYGIAFMCSKWDANVPSAETWRHVLRVLKPGGHLLAFFGTRTYHRGVVAIEDAGFEIRDCISWNFGSGFPKALDVGKAIDKLKGKERECLAKNPNWRPSKKVGNAGFDNMFAERNQVAQYSITAPATPEAEQWDGWKTALKPAFEPICLARKPLEGTVAENVLIHGTGALNVEGCRVEGKPEKPGFLSKYLRDGETKYLDKGPMKANMVFGEEKRDIEKSIRQSQVSGRYPSNVIFDDEAAAALDEQSGVRETGDLKAQHNNTETRRTYGKYNGHTLPDRPGDSGGASRYFNRCNYTEGDVASFYYCSKTSTKERDAGLPKRANLHPTVKPVQLMRHLVRLITPPGGIVLDPFMGSGSTGMAAALEGCGFIGIEMSEEYFAWAEARIAFAQENPGFFHRKSKNKKQGIKNETPIKMPTKPHETLFT